MRYLTNSRLENAARIYVLANVPMYVARQLRKDDSVVELSIKFDSERLKIEFSKSISVSPTTIFRLVKPFVIAVALALKGSREDLDELLNCDLSDFRWLREVVGGLLAQTPASTENKIESSLTPLGGQLNEGRQRASSSNSYGSVMAS